MTLLLTVSPDQVMYFDNDVDHALHAFNLSARNVLPQKLTRVGSLTPYAIAVDANFVYLSNQHPRYVAMYPSS